jgi:hypothetical protein
VLRGGIPACGDGRLIFGSKTCQSGPFDPEKHHPEIGLHYSWLKFSVLGFKFPAPSQNFPVLLSREFRCKSLNLLACQLSKSHQAGEFNKIPCSFPC